MLRVSCDRVTRPRLLIASAITASVALVAALVAAIWFGIGWGRAVFVDQPKADNRESALDGARQAAVNLASMNPDDVAGSVRNMESSSTGAVLDKLTQNKDKLIQTATDSKARVDCTVLTAGLTALDTDEDTANAIVVMTQTTTYAGKPPTKQRITWTLALHKDGDIWKAAQADALGDPVALDEPAPAPAPEPGK